ncbi:hypothetical protein BaRGS_00000204 [Batillaria attramentaria]|uniref:Uncharacterized protein n=1 Tax=Batillaria attramentaria TaxID=370345 RepID=A0ABD0MCV0_9CAEN
MDVVGTKTGYQLKLPTALPILQHWSASKMVTVYVKSLARRSMAQGDRRNLTGDSSGRQLRGPLHWDPSVHPRLIRAEGPAACVMFQEWCRCRWHDVYEWSFISIISASAKRPQHDRAASRLRCLHGAC